MGKFRAEGVEKWESACAQAAVRAQAARCPAELFPRSEATRTMLQRFKEAKQRRHRKRGGRGRRNVFFNIVGKTHHGNRPPAPRLQKDYRKKYEVSHLYREDDEGRKRKPEGGEM